MPFMLPQKCLRGFNTCKPLSQIEADNHESFFCCGENDGSMSLIPEDRFTVCFKGQFRDQISFNDRRDLAHTAAVIVQALAITEPYVERADKDSNEEG